MFDLNYKWVALTVTVIGIFMVGLDSRIVIIGLPQVAFQLHADPEQAIWITQSYVLTTTLMLLLIGRLADIFGRVRIYSYGFAIFTIGSGLTSLGQDPLQVIVFRAIQGLGASFIFANSIAIITDSTPRGQLGLFVGINQISFRAGALLGLTLSGLILSFLDWRALFYINIPVGIFGTWWARRRLKEVAQLDPNRRIDWLGFAFFAIFLLCLMVALTIGSYGSARLTLVYALLPISIVFLILFIIRERRVGYPLLDLKMFRIREVTGGVLAVFLNVIAWAAALLLLSLQFQIVLGQSPLEAGISILPFEVAFLAVGPLSGTLSDRFGYSRFTISGLALGSVAMLLFAVSPMETPYVVLTVYMIVLGVGTGLFLAPNLRSVMGPLPPQRRGIGSAFVSLFLNIGLTISLNLAVLIMSFTVPYSVITEVISTLSYSQLTPEEQALFYSSIQNTYFVIAVINALGIIPSAFQIRRGSVREAVEKEKFVALEG